MADTGERSPQAQSGFQAQGAYAIDSNESTQASVIQYNTAALYFFVSDFDGDDIPAGSTINGVKLIIRANYSISFAATKFNEVRVSLDGVSGTYSGNIGAQNLTTSAADYDFGGDDELWGLDWSGWTDLSNLAFKVQVDQQNASDTVSITQVSEIDAIIYYAGVPEPTVKIASGTLTLKGGNFTIK
tara:strand:+ start:1037 stop:1594 length:558 start_codon:yes stop_codon:yes gene_type:complete